MITNEGNHRTGTIAYVYPQRFHFVTKDIEGLRERLTVKEHRFSSGGAWALPWDFLGQFLFLIRCKLLGIRSVVAHFAGYHTVLPAFLGFRTFIIVAGSDACSFPGIDYGSFRKPWMARAIRYSMRKAARILPVHRSLERFINDFSDLGPREQGYGHFVQGRIAPSTAIPYGFDVHHWSTATAARQPRSVLCIATGAAHGNAVHFRKGIDLLLEAALSLPDHTFTIIGVADTDSYTHLPPNLSVLGKCPPHEVASAMASHTVYAQPSVMEGFPNALCEAMLAGCLPIVSNMTSMPEIVGESGVVIHERRSSALVAAITRSTSLDAEQQARSRTKAAEQVLPFSLQRRIDALVDLVGSDTPLRT
ncbi:MAG: glycosyltransferase family 4 protein [Flavobacteriales bacterium]